MAVTGATGHAIQVRDASDPVRRKQDRIIVANWGDPTLLAGETFDTVLADYLIGAIEGFAPYFQEDMRFSPRSVTAILTSRATLTGTISSCAAHSSRVRR